MNPALWISKTGLDAQNKDIAVISNNLANASTIGFKKSRAVFEDLLYQNINQPGGRTAQDTEAPSGLMLGAGTKVVATQKIHTQGDMVTTDNALDIAIDGDGFFQVLLPDGTMGYTRNGTFSRNAEGSMTTASGYVMQPQITIPSGAAQIAIAQDGIITAKLAGEAAPTELGQVTTATFANPRGLKPLGENFFAETSASGAASVGVPFTEGRGKLVQGSLESSNVNVVQQLVEMIETQRAYEVSSKSITAADEMMRYISNNL